MGSNPVQTLISQLLSCIIYNNNNKSFIYPRDPFTTKWSPKEPCILNLVQKS